MKKLFSAISAVLCTAMLVMSVSAISIAIVTDAPPDLGEKPDMADPYAVFHHVMYESGKLQYAEIAGKGKGTSTLEGGQPRTTMYAMNLKLIASPNGGLYSENLEWNQDSEITRLTYSTDDYFYDSIKKERYRTGSSMGSQMYFIAGLRVPIDDLESLTMKKISDGYEFRYQISREDASFRYSYTVVADKNYILKSVRGSFYYSTYKSYEFKSNFKYEFVSVNKPFTIGFPHDLDQYKLVD